MWRCARLYSTCYMWSETTVCKANEPTWILLHGMRFSYYTAGCVITQVTSKTTCSNHNECAHQYSSTVEHTCTCMYERYTNIYMYAQRHVTRERRECISRAHCITKKHVYKEEQIHIFHTTHPDGHVMYTDVQGTVHCTKLMYTLCTCTQHTSYSVTRGRCRR